MEELGKLSPVSRESSLEALPRKELQQLAKESGVKGNSKSKDIVQALLAILDGTAEATRADSNDYASSIPPTAEKPLRNLSDTASTIQSAKRPTAQSSDAVAVELETAGDKQVQNAQQEIPDSPPLNSTPSTVLEHATSAQAPLHTDPATAVLTASPHASDPEATKPLAAANASQDTSKEASSAVQVGTPADGIEGDASAEPDIAATVAIMSEAATASGTAVKVRASDTPRSACIADALDTGNATVTGEASLTAEASQHTHPTAMPQATQSADARAADSSIEAAQPAAAAAEHPDCISNPLYEEPCTAHLQAPVSLDAAQQPAPLVATEAPSLTTQPAAAEHNTLAATAPCQLDSSQASSPALLKPAVPPAADTDATNTAEAAVSVTAAEGIPPADDVRPAAATEATAAIPAGEKSAREPTPEDVANLGKAVAAVQARSCQLSPSLLTLQSSADMGSPAHDVFERGRKSGIWQGATEVELRQLERQWDDYKSVATRGWELPNLQEVQAKSDSLAASGFATVGSPVLSKATREAMAKQGLAGKRKARSEEAEAPVKRGSVARKAVKRAAGLTPSRKGSSTQGTPLRVGAKAGPSRLAMATSAADLENMGRAANAASTPVAHGKGSSSFAGLPTTPFSMGTSQKNAGNRGSRVIPKPRPANDRAKKAEATFAARRAAALAKSKK